MNFQEAEARFHWLERYRADLGEQTYYAELSKLCLQDEWGRWWMMQERTGQWHVYQSGQWIPALPPSLTPAPGVSAPSSVYPQQPAYLQQPAQYVPIERRKEVLEKTVSKYVRQGWHVISRTETTAQLSRDKRASCLLALILALFLLVPAVLYLLLYRGTENLYIEVDEQGKVKITS